MTVLPAFGGYFFSWLFGLVFDSVNANGVCKGAMCTYNTFVVTAVLSFFSVLINSYLYLKRGNLR